MNIPQKRSQKATTYAYVYQLMTYEPVHEISNNVAFWQV